jgi:hypothetical protein
VLDRPKRTTALAILLAALWASPAANAPPAYLHYFGNLHSHSSYSDGSGTPREAFEYARDTGQLDFLALTEHNHAAAERGAKDRVDRLLIANDPALYEEVKTAADEFNADGTFVTLWGQEFSTIGAGNHSNVFQARDVITVDDGDYRQLYENLGSELVQYNHPWNTKDAQARDYGLKQFTGFAKLRAAAGPHVRTIEVMNGPGTKKGEGLTPEFSGEKYYQKFLRNAFRLAPSADQDNHYRTWGSLTEARTVCLAERLTRAEILAAVNARRCYASSDKNLKVAFTVNGQVFGSEVAAASRDLTIHWGVEDPDEDGPTYTFTLVYGNARQPSAVIREEDLGSWKGAGDETVTFTTPFDHTFAYLKVTQSQTNQGKKATALTSPVWVNVS